MKKFITLIALMGLMMGPLSISQARAADPGAAGLLSLILPGTGEWYNNEWRGSFPWGECVIGSICVLFRWSSVMDATNGNTDEAIRLDFWSAPKK